ncbi:hypothetical protein BJY04DRAFT_206630 [Aspergillus karnatakaensis]|uniref:bZIP transcription factor n=1 Tax=Aspergillus karnatakaensis TaxID=1810916 RepID=UPI003CCE4FE7
MPTTTPASKHTGRPRLDPNSQAVLSDDRRTQIRRAQRTYRVKKEAVFRAATARVEELEAKFKTLSRDLNDLCGGPECQDLRFSHPGVYTELNRIRQSLAQIATPPPGATSGSSCEASQAPMQQSLSDDTEALGSQIMQYVIHFEHNIPTTPNTPSPTYTLSTSDHTYSHLESRLSRRIQRHALERAYQTFTSPHSHPHEVYRMFRLVPCIKDPSQMLPRLQQLLSGGSSDPLEVAGLPFYTLGGAGTHYPNHDDAGEPVYPEHMRKPGRILGILPASTGGERDRQELLQIWGMNGEWFDCRDVEGYLREQGVGGSQNIQCLGNRAFDLGFFISSMLCPCSVSWTNVILTLLGLLNGLVILGRAPGFKKADVAEAFHSSFGSH